MIQEFLEYQRTIKGLATNTLLAYEKDLRTFAIWAKGRGLSWSTIRKQDIDDYTRSQREAGLKATTTNRRISSIRALLSWAHHEGIIDTNGARYVQSSKTEQPLPQVADLQAIEKYLSTEPTTERAAKIHALVALLRDTGIRLQEALDIKLTDFDLKEQSITIHGKGNKQRKVYYTSKTVMKLIYVAGRYTPYLLPQVGQRTIRFDFYDEMKLAGIHTHPHALRHAFATEMLNKGADLKVVSHLLGHASVKTTERYAQVSNPTAREQYRSTH